MALNTFGGIKAAAADWLERTDLTAVIPDFFTMAQSKLFYGDGEDIRPLRIRQMVASATVTPATGGLVTISTGVSTTWLEFIELTPTQNGAQSMTYQDPWQFRKNAMLQASTGPAWNYTVEGDTLTVAPTATGTILAYFYQKLAAVSADGDTDWIILNTPQVYLNGIIMEACAYLSDPRLAQFRAFFAAGIMALNRNDQRARTSGGALRAIAKGAGTDGNC